MSLILIIIHVIVCIALIMIVLLQTGKGADMGAAFGGGSGQTLFGSTGASTFLTKATTAAGSMPSLKKACRRRNQCRKKKQQKQHRLQSRRPPSLTHQFRQRKVLNADNYNMPKWWNMVDTLS